MSIFSFIFWNASMLAHSCCFFPQGCGNSSCSACGCLYIFNWVSASIVSSKYCSFLFPFYLQDGSVGTKKESKRVQILGGEKGKARQRVACTLPLPTLGHSAHLDPCWPFQIICATLLNKWHPDWGSSYHTLNFERSFHIKCMGRSTLTPDVLPYFSSKFTPSGRLFRMYMCDFHFT